MAALAKDVSALTGRRVSRQSVREMLQHRAPGSCRQSARTSLAKLLDIPEKWLAGESVLLPLMAALQLNEPVDQKPGGEPIFAHLAPTVSPRLQLATERLLGSCIAACERDLRRLTIDATVADPRDRFDPAEQLRDDVLNYLTSAMLALTSVRSWSGALLRAREVERKLTVAAQKALLDGSWAAPKPAPVSKTETASLYLLRGFEAILEPWFADKQCLDYARLRAAFVGMRGPVATIPCNCVRPTRVRRANGELVSLGDRFIPLSLLRWRSDSPDEVSQDSDYTLETAESESRSLKDVGSVADRREK